MFFGIKIFNLSVFWLFPSIFCAFSFRLSTAFFPKAKMRLSAKKGLPQIGQAPIFFSCKNAQKGGSLRCYFAFLLAAQRWKNFTSSTIGRTLIASAMETAYSARLICANSNALAKNGT